MSFTSLEELDCWKACREIQRFIKPILRKMPAEEKYDLVDNMKRAARSSSRNIGEGFGRFSYRENIKFCVIARGSLHEVVDDLITCNEESFVTKEEYTKGTELLSKAIALLNGYINYLERAKVKTLKISETEEPFNA